MEKESPCVSRPGANRGARARGSLAAFTLAELLTSLAIIAILAALSMEGLGRLRSIAQGAACANNLRQLGAATSLYLSDHKNTMFPYSRGFPATGRLWYYGFEPTASLNAPEGTRTVDVTQAPLYPYIPQAGGVEICPSFPYNSPIWMPKYKQGAICTYGFNMVSFPTVSSTASGVNILSILHPSQVLLFGDCAQVDNFQAPASTSNPKLEEFYEFDSTSATTHFRHGGFANILFLDGHEEKFTMYPGTLAQSLPSVNVGRFTPTGSSTYLTGTSTSLK